MAETIARELEIARTILNQLTGGTGISLRQMIGAEHVTALSSGVQFSFKGCRKANKCVIKLNAMDLYDVAFYKLNKKTGECPLKSEFMALYADQMVEVFEEYTGLYLRLF